MKNDWVQVSTSMNRHAGGTRVNVKLTCFKLEGKIRIEDVH